MTYHFQNYDNIGEMMADRSTPRYSLRQKDFRSIAENLLTDYGFKRKTYGVNILTLINSDNIIIRLSHDKDIHEILNADGTLHSAGKTSELIRKLQSRLERKANEPQTH